MGNTYNKIKQKSSERNGKKLQETARSVLDGSFLTRERVVRLFPFILYITFLAILYIANSFYAEKRIIEIDRVRKELKELRYTYISTEKTTRVLSKQSEVARKVEKLGIKESKVPPKKLSTKTIQK